MYFSDVLNDLIIESGLSKRQIAIKCGITTSQMTSFLRGAIPTIKTIIKLSNYFNCSINYLMGIDEDKSQTKILNLEYDLENFIDRYKRVLKQNNTTHWKLCNKLGISESISRDWKKGSTPKLETLYKISLYLNCSIDYLLGRAKY